MSKKEMTAIEIAIKDRLENGFRNWNGGYESWLKWCNTLYDDQSIYNVYGKRLTLQEYKDMMGDFLGKYDIQLGKFHNMIIQDEWCAIRYDVIHIDKKTGEETTLESMEFVKFKQLPEPYGVKVVEGWATSTNQIH
jgi:hypothetical protein